MTGAGIRNHWTQHPGLRQQELDQEPHVTELIEIDELKKRIAALEQELEDLESRLPAHSIPPNLIDEMDRLDEEIQSKKSRLAALQAGQQKF
jgi:chromosome segregation ATPase